MMIDHNPKDELNKEKEYALMRFSFGTIMCYVTFGVASAMLCNFIARNIVEMEKLRQSIERLEDPHVQDFLNKYYYRQAEDQREGN